MTLRNATFEPEYRSGIDDLVRDFYHRALEHAISYSRAVGFFSSTVFEIVGAPLGDFVAKGGTMRLVTSVALQEEDARAISEGHDLKTTSEARLLEQIARDFSQPVGRGASLLVDLLRVGRLDIKIAMPRSGRGIFHEKVGIFVDDHNDYVAFSGSSNESRSGLEGNYECIDVFSSWDDEKRASAKRKHFEKLWAGTADGVLTLEFPEAARRDLLRLQPAKGASSQPSSRQQDLWEHQVEAVNEFLKHRRGILEMATGTGKTRVALHICEVLLGHQVDSIVVATEGNDLLDQWYEQLLALTQRVPHLRVVRHYRTHHDREAFTLDPVRTVLLVSRSALAPALRALAPAQAHRTLLIHDEVHGLGSPATRESLAGLATEITFRLGLSATPEREYDAAGNAFVLDQVGPVIYKFGLEEAIRIGVLAPFSYFPLSYHPDAADRESIQAVYKMEAARKHSGNPMSKEDRWIELARVHKLSRAKLPPFTTFIRSRPDLLRRCIIFVETRDYGEEVLAVVHPLRHDFHTYYADEDAATLKRFASGELECLITCHKLSQGVDIRSLETVILFSSARARLETIQRMGRCLRSDPVNRAKRANVVDFVRIEHDSPDAPNVDTERRDWLAHLSMIEPKVTHGP